MTLINKSKFPLFAGVEDDVFEQLINAHSVDIVTPNTTLIAKGKTNKHVYLLLSGQVGVYTLNKKKPVRVLQAGAVFGEISVLDAKPATASIITNAQCKLLMLNEREIWLLCEKSHAFTKNILHLVVKHSRRVANQLNESFDYVADIKKQAYQDALTQLLNRKWLDEKMPSLVEKCQTKNITLSYLMLDIDHFKVVNDTYGHDVGDAVLKQMGCILTHYARARDAAVRYGGEEICLLLVGLSKTDALAVAERLRKSIEATPFTYANNKSISVTVSIGIALLNVQDSTKSLMKRADNALYKAKEMGRNQVVKG